MDAARLQRAKEDETLWPELLEVPRHLDDVNEIAGALPPDRGAA